MGWEKQIITKDDGTNVQAMAPMIISASRSTDIPAFYSDWFFDRLKKGYSAWINPFNKEKVYISYKNCRFIVFWSKDPRPLLPYLDELEKMGIGWYLQYTLNDYEKEKLELGVPPLHERLDTFKEIALKYGKEHVIWRFDPLILTDEITVDVLLEKMRIIGCSLLGLNEKLVFSFADIQNYKKVQENLKNSGVNWKEWDEESMNKFAEGLVELNKPWKYRLATCCEKIDLDQYGIEHNKCVDDELITRISYRDNVLMKFLGIDIKCVDDFLFGADDMPKDAILIDGNYYGVRTKNNKDSGQRALCGCIISKDIGQYNTCPHMCKYCYANSSFDLACENYDMFVMTKKFGETII